MLCLAAQSLISNKWDEPQNVRENVVCDPNVLPNTKDSLRNVRTIREYNEVVAFEVGGPIFGLESLKIPFQVTRKPVPGWSTAFEFNVLMYFDSNVLILDFVLIGLGVVHKMNVDSICIVSGSHDRGVVEYFLH